MILCKFELLIIMIIVIVPAGVALNDAIVPLSLSSFSSFYFLVAPCWMTNMSLASSCHDDTTSLDKLVPSVYIFSTLDVLNLASCAMWRQEGPNLQLWDRQTSNLDFHTTLLPSLHHPISLVHTSNISCSSRIKTMQKLSTIFPLHKQEWLSHIGNIRLHKKLTPIILGSLNDMHLDELPCMPQ